MVPKKKFVEIEKIKVVQHFQVGVIHIVDDVDNFDADVDIPKNVCHKKKFGVKNIF